MQLDAAVYASPIVAHGITIVATENNTVYALDESGRQLWRVHLGDPARRADLPCGNIDPSGITGTPIYDPSTGSVFVVAEYRAPVRHELVALALGNGAVRWRVSVDLPGASPDAMQERGALAIAAGRVWVPFGGRTGDCGDYKGRVVGVRLDGSGSRRSPTPCRPLARRASGRHPAPSVDSAGHLLVAVGNGASGVGDPYDYSDSVLKIDPATARLVDSFSPTTWATDNDADLDLGSQGPALVGSRGSSPPASRAPPTCFGRASSAASAARSARRTLCASFGGTAVDGSVVYVPCTDGVRAVRIDANGSMSVLWHADGGIAGSPVVGGGRVWALDQSAGVLHALDPATGRSVAAGSGGRDQPIRDASAVRHPRPRSDAGRADDRRGHLAAGHRRPAGIWCVRT